MQFARLVNSDGDGLAFEGCPALIAVFGVGGEYHARVAVFQAGGAFGGAFHLGQIGKAKFERLDMGVEVGGVGQFLDLFHRQAFARVEGAGPDPAQVEHMCMAAKRRTEIAGDGADIAAFAAGHFQCRVIRIRPVGQYQFLDPERARGQLHFLAAAGHLVGTLPIDLDGGELRRHLFDIADELAERLLDLFIRGTQIAAGDDFALGVVRIRGLSEADGKAVGLERVGDIGDGLGRLAEGDGQNPGRGRVERAGVSGFFRTERPADLVHHGGRGGARRFVDDQPTGDVATFACHALSLRES